MSETPGAARIIGGGARHAAEELFGSPTVVDLLVLLFRDPSRRYYVNELIKLSGRFPRSVQLALAKLEAAGVVRSERQANARFYQLDQGHVFFAELGAIVAKIPNVVDVLGAGLGGVSAIRVAFLRPEEPDTVDLELVVIGEDARPAVETALRGVAERVGRPLRLEYFDVDEWSRQAKRPRSFVRWLLEEQRTYLIGADVDLLSL